jgi:hypothetical protein
VLVYVEYISRNPGVSAAAFRHVVGSMQAGWEGRADEDDVLLLDIGRTWRVGPEPEFLSVWYSPAGLERLDRWERLFAGREETVWNEPFRLAGRMDAAGCYEPLAEPQVGTSGRYYAEYFDFARGAGRDDVRSFYLGRAGRYPELELSLLVDRLGTLGPDPRGLAVWSCRRWSDLDGLVRELDAGDGPARDARGALYADLGHEIADLRPRDPVRSRRRRNRCRTRP